MIRHTLHLKANGSDYTGTGESLEAAREALIAKLMRARDACAAQIRLNQERILKWNEAIEEVEKL